jgi:alpha-L-fucosidase
VQQFSIEVYNNGAWKTIYMGDGIGACRIITLPEYYTASKIRLNILQASAIPSIAHFGVADTKSKGVRVINR